MNLICAILFGAALFAATTALAPPPPAGGPEPGVPGPTQPGAPPQMAPMAAPSASATVDPQMLARAKDWFAQLQAGKVDRSQLSTSAGANLTDATIANAQSVIGALGPPVSFVQQQAGTQGAISYAIYLVTFRDGKKLDFLFAVDKDGKIASLGLGTPH